MTRYVAAFNSNRTAAASNTFNDRLEVVTPDDVFLRRAEVRLDFLSYLTDPNSGMLRKAADCLVWYSRNNGSPVNPGDKRLPWAAPLLLSNTGTVYGTASNYIDSALKYSGRLPYLVNNSAATNNLPVQGAAYKFLANPPCPNWDPTTDVFWSSWKEQMFYAVAEAYAPNSPAPTPPNPCATRECITVDGVSGFAAVVLFAGIKQPGQSRNNNANPAYASADKSNPANYLDSVNATAILQNSPSVGAPRQFSKLGANTLICVFQDPSVGMKVDPTCSADTQCSIDSGALAAYRSGNTNNCKSSGRGPIPACKTLADRINRNNCSCKRAANDFLGGRCLGGFTDPRCQNAYNLLAAC